ncbi:glucose-6-phosphate isomerase 1, chloroplastic [Rosa chinensis]|uniref:glucose-6-phosphate isomerase 1, chloroplastic n=1 Tax=Rosa chinensis TaxID=74649 RepID=UPI001AD8AA05|nr:glucose-6-phosphate isomerase 1, chloroplastic [Rosa chinensis]
MESSDKNYQRKVSCSALKHHKVSAEKDSHFLDEARELFKPFSDQAILFELAVFTMVTMAYSGAGKTKDAHKSGGTPETRNGLLEVQKAFREAGLNFAKQGVAITQENSLLDNTARIEGWLARFPMFDWVGGRTSEMSAVGLLPAALQGIDIKEMLAGGKLMDEANRTTVVKNNPAALLALCWYWATDGLGSKDMVVLPYRDSLLLFSRYLQQLVMESIGKEFDLDGNRVNQGLTVYGNKGSTDQHAYIQQLRDRVHNFFVTFIEVLRDRPPGHDWELEPGVTCGDYLFGMLQGTRSALHSNDRESITVSVEEVTPRSVGALIALYERAVGIYASLVNINAYHQPAVKSLLSH